MSIKKISIGLFLVIVFNSCSKVPISGRRQLNMLPESELRSMSLTSYKEFLTKNPAVSASNSSDAQRVQFVGQKMANACTSYLRKEGQAKRIEGYKWEFNLVNDPAVNAWCMPGGKVVVYSGILPVTQNEIGLAVVMSHEIAHAIARHGNERMSQGLIAQAGGIGLQLALQQKPEMAQNLFLTSYGIGSQLGMLKFSRDHESEADKLGLVFMALAGYNPEEAISFWQRMSKVGGAKQPEILSTHPHDDTRIDEIRKFLPTAMKYYKK